MTHPEPHGVEVAERITAKRAAEITGYSVSWLKRHECAWCNQTCLRQTQGNCGSIYGPHNQCGPNKPKPWWRTYAAPAQPDAE